MNKCRHPDHPHCTHWVMQGASACAGGHPQPVAPAQSSHEMLPGSPATAPQPARQLERRAPAASRPKPLLHVSGFDPRAAGGRQALRLQLRDMPGDVPPQLALELRSALLPAGGARHAFARTRDGEWPSAVIEFSSRGREHGQYRIEVELLGRRDGAPPRRWTCTLVVLVPRPDATLTEIHQTFLATHKNVRVTADDGSIARLGAQAGGGRLDIDVSARNASIAQLNLDATGKSDLALPTIAWDEDLVETGATGSTHPHPAQSACLVDASGAALGVRHLRLFAFDECVIGRMEAAPALADVLLAHYGGHGPDGAGLTRRISAQHAVLRHGLHGFEIEDVSRYGLLLDGVWPGKCVPVPLQTGMRIEFTASVRDVAVLEVAALMPHAVILRRADAGRDAECFYFVAPDRHPGSARFTSPVAGSALPVLYHAQGGFWHLDRTTGFETALYPGVSCESLPGMTRQLRFAGAAYPELGLPAARAGGARRQSPLRTGAGCATA